MFRHRIEAQKRIKQYDGIGWVYDWETVAYAWAHIRPTSAKERYNWQKENVDITHKISINMPLTVGLDEKEFRLKAGDKIFEIVSVINALEQNRRLDLACKELKQDGV